jgi:hypothetical protein
MTFGSLGQQNFKPYQSTVIHIRPAHNAGSSKVFENASEQIC